MVRSVQGLELDRGLYYVTGGVILNASNLLARVTIVSGGRFFESGSQQGIATVFTPYVDHLLFASQFDLANNTANTDQAEDAMIIAGSGSRFEGAIVAVNGRTSTPGSSNTFTCPVMGDRVRLNGSLNYYNGGCESIIPQPPLLDIQKTPDVAADTGGQITPPAPAVFTITVKNTGGLPATNVTVNDVLPTDGNITWTRRRPRRRGAR